MPQSDPFLVALQEVRASSTPPSSTKQPKSRGVMPLDSLRTMAEAFNISEAEARRIYTARGYTIEDDPAAAGGADDDPFLAALDSVRSEQPTPKADTRSRLARGYDAVFTPPEAITRGARMAADAIDAPALDRSRLHSMGRGFVAGAVQGAASLLTPGDVLLTATGLGPLARALRGVRGGAGAVRGAQVAADAATVARGGERVLTAESPSEVAAGAAQIALGGVSGAASRAVPAPAAREPLALPLGPSYVGGPGGVVARAGTDIPVPQVDDPSFVRGVPAEYARRDVHGALPPGPRFIAGEGGAVGALDALDDPFLAVLAEVRSPRKGGGSDVRSVRAEVLSETPGGRVRQYSGDPAARAPSVARRQLSPELESKLSTVREDAKRQGFSGSDDELDALFLEKLTEAREVARDLSGVADDTDILRAVADLGGISMTAESRGGKLWGTKGELKKLFEEMDYGTTAGGFNRRTGGVASAKYGHQGGLRGVGPIVTQLKDGLSLDKMAEALRERGFEIEGPNQLLDEVERALVKFRKGADDAPGVTSALEGLLDVRPGGKWWKKPEDEYTEWARVFDEIVAAEKSQKPKTKAEYDQMFAEMRAEREGSAASLFARVQAQEPDIAASSERLLTRFLSDEGAQPRAGASFAEQFAQLEQRNPAAAAKVERLLHRQIESLPANTTERQFAAYSRRLSDANREKILERLEAGERVGGKGDGGKLIPFQSVKPDAPGYIRPELLRHLAGGLVGAAGGGAAIEEDDPYWKAAAKVIGGAALGTAAPALLHRGGARALPEARATILPMQRTITKGERGRPVVTYVAERAGDVPRVGRSGTSKADPLAGVDTFLGKFSNPLVRDGIRERLIVNSGFADQRRQAVSSSDVAKFAEAVKVDASKALPKGSAASAEVITAYARGLRQTQERIAALAAKVNGGTATDADVLALEMARADGDVLLKSLMGLRGEAGRALGALRAVGGVFDSGNVELTRGAAQVLREEAARFAAEFAKLPADELARYQWLKKQGRATLWDKTRSYWYANLLSGVKTHERNVLGNVFNAIGNTITHPLAAGVDALRSAATGGRREVLFSELPRGFVGLFAGIDRGLSDAVFTLRHGITPRALAKGMKSAELGKLDLPRYEFAGGGVNPFNWPGRMLDSADAFFRSVARNGELYETAFTAAKREGLTGDRLKRRMSELITGTSAEAVALREQAEHVAARAVFQEKGGPITSFLAKGYEVPGIGQAMTFTIPFLRTPGNILRQGLEASPVGFAMKEARSGGRAGALAQGKAVAGSVAAAYLAWLASTGRLSGHGPKDAKERAKLMDAGWRPNSVRIGDKWVGYQLFQPVSVQAAIIANAFEAWRDAGANEQDMAGVVGQTLARATNSFTEQSFLSGLSDFQQALSDPQRWGSRWVGRTAQGLTPFAGMQRTITSGLDPKVRQPRTVVDQMKSSIPGLSTSVPARLDRFGQDIEREGGPVRRMADPFNTSSVQHDPVFEELERLEVDLTGLSAKMQLPGNRELTDAESRRVMQAQGQAMRAAIERVMGQPNYSRYPDKLKTSLLTKAIEKARADLRKQVSHDVLRGRPVLRASQQ